jgi:hypothetical protein
MLEFIPRLRRRVEESYLPVGTGSRAGTPRTNSRTSTLSDSRTGVRPDSRMDARVEARLEGPPIFLDPDPAQLREESVASPPPSYSDIRAMARPEIQQLLPGNRLSFGRPSANMQNATPRSTVTSIEDIRHGDIVHHIHMGNRLSSVPQYPMFLEPGRSSNRRRRSQRRDSLASTSTGRAFLAIGKGFSETRTDNRKLMKSIFFRSIARFGTI